MDWLLCEDILMRNWISVLEGGYRPEADMLPMEPYCAAA